MNKTTLMLMLTLAASASCLAEESVPPPTEPFVQVPPPGTKWTLRVDYPKDQSPETLPTDRPVTVQGQIGQEAAQVSVRNANGQTLSGYVFGDTLLRKNNETGRVLILPSDEGNVASPFFVMGYPGMAWLSRETYRGVEKKEGEPCYTFHLDAEVFSDPADGFSHPDLTAWVRVEDKKPMAFRIGSIDYVYTGLARTSPTLNLPQDIRLTLEKLAQQQRALEAMKRQ